MKLTIERLTALSPQDLIDLGKIWPHQQPEQWQSWLSDGKVLFAARFNERLLGAVKIALQDDRAELQDLLVREVTPPRRRSLRCRMRSVSCRRLPTGSCRPPARRRANAGKSITSCAPAASHRRAISGKMKRRLAALVLIALGLAAALLGRQQALRRPQAGISRFMSGSGFGRRSTPMR